jgi:hypothetical protein
MPDEKLMREFSLANVPSFYARVAEAFAFLPATYKCELSAQTLDAIDGFRDTQAKVVYVGEKIEVDIVWSFASALISVNFVELLIPYVSPFDSHVRPKERPRVITLFDLAAARGHGDDPALTLGDGFQTGGRITNKRFKLLHNDMAGVIAGLARATERDASDILRGDTSIFPEVLARFNERKRAAGFW